MTEYVAEDDGTIRPVQVEGVMPADPHTVEDEPKPKAKKTAKKDSRT